MVCNLESGWIHQLYYFLWEGVFSGVFNMLISRRRFTRSLFFFTGLPILGFPLLPRDEFISANHDKREKLRFMRNLVKEIFEEAKESIDSLPREERIFILSYWYSLEQAYKYYRLEPLYINFLELLFWKLGIKPSCHILNKILRGEYSELEYTLTGKENL